MRTLGGIHYAHATHIADHVILFWGYILPIVNFYRSTIGYLEQQLGFLL